MEELSKRKLASPETRLSAIEAAKNKGSVAKTPENANDRYITCMLLLLYVLNLFRLIAEIRNLRPNSAKRMEACQEVEKTMKTDVQRKVFLNPLMQVCVHLICTCRHLFIFYLRKSVRSSRSQKIEQQQLKKLKICEICVK